MKPQGYSGPKNRGFRRIKGWFSLKMKMSYSPSGSLYGFLSSVEH